MGKTVQLGSMAYTQDVKDMIWGLDLPYRADHLSHTTAHGLTNILHVLYTELALYAVHVTHSGLSWDTPHAAPAWVGQSMHCVQHLYQTRPVHVPHMVRAPGQVRPGC